MEYEELDERSKRLIEKFQRLPQQYKEWFVIAACEPEPAYQAMLQTITKENERQWVMKIREAWTGGRELQYKRAANAPTMQSEALAVKGMNT